MKAHDWVMLLAVSLAALASMMLSSEVSKLKDDTAKLQEQIRSLHLEVKAGLYERGRDDD